MNNKWLVVGIVAIVLGIAGIGAIGALAYAQRPVTLAVGMLGTGGFMGAGGMMTGPGRGFGFGAQQSSLIEIAAKTLNLTVTDLIAELQKGKTIVDVAKEKNVSTDKIVDDFIATRTQVLKSAVDAKRITQAQADAMLALMKANVAQELTQTWSGRGIGLGMTLAPRASAGVGQDWNGAAPYGMMGPNWNGDGSYGQNFPMHGGRMGGRGGWQ